MQFFPRPDHRLMTNDENRVTSQLTLPTRLPIRGFRAFQAVLLCSIFVIRTVHLNRF